MTEKTALFVAGGVGFLVGFFAPLWVCVIALGSYAMFWMKER